MANFFRIALACAWLCASSAWATLPDPVIGWFFSAAATGKPVYSSGSAYLEAQGVLTSLPTCTAYPVGTSGSCSWHLLLVQTYGTAKTGNYAEYYQAFKNADSSRGEYAAGGWWAYQQAQQSYCASANSTSTSNGAHCVCSAGFVDSGGVCTADPAAANATCDALNASNAKLVGAAGSSSLTVCYQGSTVTGTGAVFGIKNGVKTAATIFGPFKCAPQTSGTACSDTGTAPAGAADCKKGQYFGQVNGVNTCVNGSGGLDTGTTSYAPNPAGSASNPTSGVDPLAPPGTTGKSTSTTCDGATCTSTTTYTKSDGTTAGTKTDTKPQPTFCQDNPESNICKSSTFTPGPCDSAPVCDGDAVSCGIAAQTFATKCALTTEPLNDSNIAAFKVAAAVAHGDQTASVTSTVNVNAGMFDQTNFLGSASGAADFSVSMPFGGHFSVPMSGVNLWLARLGFVLQAVTFVLCARIVARG